MRPPRLLPRRASPTVNQDLEANDLALSNLCNTRGSDSLQELDVKVGDGNRTRSAAASAARELVEQAQVVGTEVGIAENAGEGATTEFPVERDDERVPAPRLLQADVAAALADDFPALLAKRLDQALAGDDRLARAHAGRGIERRITPLSSGSPSSRSPST